MDALIDCRLEFGELAGQTEIVRRPVGHELGHGGTVEASVDAGEEQSGPQSERSDPVAMGLGDSLDHAVETKASQVVRHSPLSDGCGRLPDEHCELLAQ